MSDNTLPPEVTNEGSPQRDQEFERSLAIAFKLSPLQSAMLAYLLKTKVASAQQLREYSDCAASARMPIFHIRERLKSHGIEIGSRQGVGYWLTEDDKRKVTDYTETFFES